MRRGFVRLAVLAVLLLPLPLSAQFEVSGRAATLRVGGRLHARYAASSVDGLNDFFIRRARIIVDLTVDDFLEGRLQPGFGGGVATIQDAYVRLNFSPQFRLSVGKFKRAFDLFELSSSTDLSLIERSGLIRGLDVCSGVGGMCSYSTFTGRLLYAGRDVGVRVEGEAGSVSYSATVTNGPGILAVDTNTSKSASGRLTYHVTDDFRASGQVALHDYIDPVDENANAVAFGGDIEYGTWRDGLLVQASLIYGDNWELDPVIDEPPSFLTFQGVASYFYPVDRARLSGIEPLARVSYGDPNTDVDDDAGLLVTPGVMFYISGRNKIGANLDIYAPSVGDEEFSLKVQTFLYF